jgi:hypothetical protein
LPPVRLVILNLQLIDQRRPKNYTPRLGTQYQPIN